MTTWIINTIVNYDWNNTETFLITWHISIKPLTFESMLMSESSRYMYQWTHSCKIVIINKNNDHLIFIYFWSQGWDVRVSPSAAVSLWHVSFGFSWLWRRMFSFVENFRSSIFYWREKMENELLQVGSSWCNYALIFFVLI